MKMYESFFMESFGATKTAALQLMTESLESWDIEKSPEIPQLYKTSYAIYQALRAIEKDAFENFLKYNSKKDRP